jgi:DNA-binding NarL/FixJ family response regulator
LTTAIIADDHHLVVEGMRLVLDDSGKVTVLGVALTGADAIAMYRRLRSDIVLMDLSLPDMDGIKATEQILKSHPAARVIMVSMYDHPDYVRRAMAAGAKGYLLKKTSPHELLEAISSVLDGRQYFSPSIAQWLICDGVSTATKSQRTGVSLLSDREIEVLRLMVQSKSTKLIAEDLGVSPKTVETHRRRMMIKLKIKDLAALVLFAARHGLVDTNA